MAGSDSTRSCEHCGVPISGDPRKRFCSKSCKDKARIRPGKEANCLECGKAFRFTPNKKGMFCSVSCSVKHRHADPEWKAKDDARRARQSNRQWLSKNQGAFSPVMDATCLHCQKVHTKSQGAGRVCSVECRQADAEQHKMWNIRMFYDQPLTQIKICPETGWLFKPEHNGQKYATREIAYRVGKRVAKAKRRARKKNNGRMESIDPVEVFRSVDYVCQICACQTEEDKRGMVHDRAPQLDHIIPLAQGGTHTWGNVQCACRACNIAKSDSLPKKHRADQRVLAL